MNSPAIDLFFGEKYRKKAFSDGCNFKG